VIGSHLFGWRFGIGVVVGRDDSRYDWKVESAFIVCVVFDEDAVVVDVAVVRWWQNTGPPPTLAPPECDGGGLVSPSSSLGLESG